MKKILIPLLFTCSIVYAQNGKVGINTNMPAAALHVNGGDVLFKGLANLPGNPLDPPVSGEGTRWMWYPDKAAFRSGYVNGGQWNKDSIGPYSLASGYNVKAFGAYSVAMGYEAKALSFGVVSLGNFTSSKAYWSMNIGNYNYTPDTAFYANAFGNANYAMGEYSSAIGNVNGSYGDNSFTLGNYNYALANNSMSIGNNSTAAQQYAVALGHFTYASGYNSFAGGYATNAAGDNSLALGYSSSTLGYGSVSLGPSSSARGRYAVSLGLGTQANGYAGLTAGMYNDTLVSPQTTAVQNTTPLFIVGNGTNYNLRSNAFVVRKDGHVGIGNINPQYGLHVAATSGSDGGWAEGVVIENTAAVPNAGEAAISFRNADLPTGKQWTLGINNGAPSLAYSYSNGFNVTGTKMVIDTNGNLGLGTTAPTFRVHIVNNDPGGGGWTQGLNLQNTAADTVPGEVAVSFRNNALPQNRYWMVGINESASGLSFNYGNQLVSGLTRMYIDTTGKVGVGTISPGFLLEVDGTAGKPGGGAWSASSDARLKKDIVPYTDGLQTILKINPVRYHYNTLSGYDTAPEYVGVIAQELQKIAPYMVSTSDKKMTDGTSGYLQVDNSAMTYMLINAVKEQQQEIDALEKEFDQLLSSLTKSQEDK